MAKEIDALKQARKDIGAFNLLKEDEDFFDDRVSSKCDNDYYEQGDGETEIEYKKMLRKIDK